MAAQGKDLTRPRDIDFVIVFEHASSAEQFAEHFRELGYAVSVEDTALFEDAEKEKDFHWDVTVVKHMAPTHEGITDFEDLLLSVADRWNGHNDGWGFLSKPSTH
jgi:regulator of RNase E activity RraB